MSTENSISAGRVAALYRKHFPSEGTIHPGVSYITRDGVTEAVTAEAPAGASAHETPGAKQLAAASLEVEPAGATRPELPVRYRDFVEGDKNLVLSNWLRSNRNHAGFESMDHDDYFYDHQKTIAEIAATSNIKVCCSLDDPNLIYGWMCWRPASVGIVVHYVYVKQAFRKLGLAEGLLKSIGWESGVLISASHWSEKVGAVKTRYNLIHKPRLQYRNT